MIRSTLGAPLGGTTRGGHQGLEVAALWLITPPNFGGGGGICFPSIGVVPLGEPDSPVACWAATGTLVNITASKNLASSDATALLSPHLMLCAPMNAADF